MLTNKNCKFLFYNFNNYLNRVNQPIQLIRHTKISDNDFPLKILQEKNSCYFIKRILEDSQRDLTDLVNLDTAIDIKQNKIIVDAICNITIRKELYKAFYNSVDDNLPEYPNYMKI